MASIENCADTAMCGYFIDGCNKSETTFRETGVEPIPLTEDWLVKLEYDKDEWSLKRMIDADEEESDVIWEVRRAYTDKNGNNQWIYYCDVIDVHDWQNLYFALTGQELELKDQGG